MNEPMETKMTIKTFNMNRIDFSEKAGIRRKRPRTIATSAAAISVPNPVLVKKEKKVACGLRLANEAVTTIEIGTTTSQPLVASP